MRPHLATEAQTSGVLQLVGRCMASVLLIWCASSRPCRAKALVLARRSRLERTRASIPQDVLALRKQSAGGDCSFADGRTSDAGGDEYSLWAGRVGWRSQSHLHWLLEEWWKTRRSLLGARRHRRLRALFSLLTLGSCQRRGEAVASMLGKRGGRA